MTRRSATMQVVRLLLACNLLLMTACGGRVIGGDDDTRPPKDEPAASEPHVLIISDPLYPTWPLFFDATLDHRSSQLTMVVSALSADDRTTRVGQEESAGPFKVSSDGLYVAELDIVIPLAAIPWDGYPEDILAKLRLEAERPDCGGVIGELRIREGQPLYYWHTATFAMVPATDPTARTTPLIDCAGNRANPLP